MHLKVRTLDFLKKGQKHCSLLFMCESEASFFCVKVSLVHKAATTYI